MKAALALAVVCGAAGLAHAGPALRLHAEAASSLLGGDEDTSVSFRGFFGASLGDGTAGVHPFVGGGLHVGDGVLEVPDPRGEGGHVELGYSTIGPEVRVGLAVHESYVDDLLYVAYAPTHVEVDPRLMINRVDHVQGGRGFRAGVGLLYTQALYRAAAESIERAGHDDSGDVAILGFVLPTTIELTYERATGSDRFGVSFGWGI